MIETLKGKDFLPRYANSLMGLKVTAARVIALKQYGKNKLKKKQRKVIRKKLNLRNANYGRHQVSLRI